MKASLISICLFATGFCFSQNSTLNITNLETRKEKVIKENKRIKITTLSGGKRVGRLQIIDENTIMLRGIPVSLSEIAKIKKHPLIGSIGNTVGFLALGSGTAILGIIASDPLNEGEDTSDIQTYVGIAFAIGAIYASTQPINLFDKGYGINRKWQFSLEISSAHTISE